MMHLKVKFAGTKRKSNQFAIGQGKIFADFLPVEGYQVEGG